MKHSLKRKKQKPNNYKPS